MFVHPHINPVAFSIGPLEVHWYGLMYLAGFLMALYLGRYRIRTRPETGWKYSDMDDLLFYGVLGVVLGGRLGYVFFYQPGFYLSHPIQILHVWQGGMSFHGGLLGVLIAMGFYARKQGRKWLVVMDFIAPLVPLGLGAGRLGNFINGELPGRVTDVPWAMVFPSTDNLPRHPSQLYEFALEGVVLFIILWIYSSKPRVAGKISALFLICYGTARFLVEFTRAPDPFLGYLALGLTMGQWLSLPMIVIGFIMFWFLNKKTGDINPPS
ncbi:MAG TPA: prolipoprotein diacylglyceryl transferase [Burkholderiales bacterium]|nr:prolipoprotein diacylglyceryl transferase [Burkholderiales bacterium]